MALTPFQSTDYVDARTLNQRLSELEEATLSVAQIPAGVIIPYLGSAAPRGYLACDGSGVSRTSYADLFAVVGTTFGAGDGSTTFNLPDFRGRIPIGVGQGTGLTNRLLGQGIGTETHPLTAAQLPAHTHPGIPTVNAAQLATATGQGTPDGTGNLSNTGNGIAHNNMQPTLFAQYAIKA